MRTRNIGIELGTTKNSIKIGGFDINIVFHSQLLAKVTTNIGLRGNYFLEW